MCSSKRPDAKHGVGSAAPFARWKLLSFFAAFWQSGDGERGRIEGIVDDSEESGQREYFYKCPASRLVIRSLPSSLDLPPRHSESALDICSGTQTRFKVAIRSDKRSKAPKLNDCNPRQPK